VYLGLVLVGATPQVLANAAMTRQFDVKDDLDKKPDNATADPTRAATTDSDRKITRSVERFLSKFKTVASVSSICSSPGSGLRTESLRWQRALAVKPDISITHVPLDQFLAVTNLPRAGLWFRCLQLTQDSGGRIDD
jgi:hypothetical protein